MDKLRIRSHDLLERITESGEDASSIDDGDVRSYLKLMWGNIAVRIAAAVFFIFIIAMVALAMHLHPGKNGETEAPATPATASAAERQLTEEELRELEIQNAINNELMTYTDLGMKLGFSTGSTMLKFMIVFLYLERLESLSLCSLDSFGVLDYSIRFTI